MHSRWGMVDSLMREIGALRNEARALDPRAVDEKIVADIDRVIADAAQAIDETIAEPEEESRLIGACEAIIVARERIEALRATAKRSGEIVGRSIELRRQTAGWARSSGSLPHEAKRDRRPGGSDSTGRGRPPGRGHPRAGAGHHRP